MQKLQNSNSHQIPLITFMICIISHHLIPNSHFQNHISFFKKFCHRHKLLFDLFNYQNTISIQQLHFKIKNLLFLSQKKSIIIYFPNHQSAVLSQQIPQQYIHFTSLRSINKQGVHFGIVFYRFNTENSNNNQQNKWIKQMEQVINLQQCKYSEQIKNIEGMKEIFNKNMGIQNRWDKLFKNDIVLLIQLLEILGYIVASWVNCEVADNKDRLGIYVFDDNNEIIGMYVEDRIIGLLRMNVEQNKEDQIDWFLFAYNDKKYKLFIADVRKQERSNLVMEKVIIKNKEEKGTDKKLIFDEQNPDYPQRQLVNSNIKQQKQKIQYLDVYQTFSDFLDSKQENHKYTQKIHSTSNSL